jgi:uncharacterized protein (TIGR00369 family)
VTDRPSIKENAMDIRTHLRIDPELCGRPDTLEKGYCRISFTAIDRMAADDQGLVHGGFVFGLADYAAMLAVNDPYVVLGAADVKFLKPVSVGEHIVAEARVGDVNGRKHLVDVVVARDDEKLLEGRLTCFVLDRHVLD